MVRCLIPKIVDVLQSIAQDILDSNSEAFSQSSYEKLSFDLITLNLKETLKQAIIVNKQPLSKMLQTKNKSLFDTFG
jgi:hypothetical protein